MLAAGAVAAFAQAGTGGTILGTVTDPTNAIVPNVQITITDTDTGQSHQATTNSAGRYVAPDLRIGHYTVRAEAAGFKSAERAGIVLNVGASVRTDFTLQLGSTQQSVTVEANPVAIQTESGAVSQVITGSEVTQLATNGRSLYALTALVPGASSNMSDFQIPTAVSGDSSVSFNGQRQSHNLFMIDGGEDLDRGGSGNISVMPSMDAIAEFRTLTSNYSAEYGLSSAGTTTIALKSGTKQFHATAWEFNRNNAFDAGNYFTNAAGQKAPELRFYTYGFNVSGPVFIPKVYNKDKEKTFFFYNMEWRKLIQGQTLNRTVPLASEYGGQFPAGSIHVPSASQISPQLQGQFAPLAPGADFPNGTIPASLLNPNAQALLQAGIFPKPSSGAQFVGGNAIPTNVREEIVRIDQRFSDNFSVFGHWIDDQVSQGYGTSQWSGDNVPTVGDTFGNPSYSGVIDATWSISPTLLNETSFNYNGNRIHITPTGIFTRPTGFNVPELFAGNNLDRIPGISLGGSTGATYDVSSWPWNNRADDYQIRDDITWIKGAHELKFGGAWMLYKKVQDLFGDTQGSFGFNGNYTGNDFADFLLGYANSYTELAVQDAGHWDNKSYDAYIQDNWKVNSRLTLNLGLRWDGIPHTYEENNRMSNFYPGLYNPANAAILLPNGNISSSSPGLGTSPNPLLKGYQFYLNGMGIAGQNGIPKGLVNNDWALFGPRLGFAYDLTGAGKTVLRGGFGIMYERIQGNDVYNAGPNIPFSSNVTLNNVSLSNP
ncbi:MAG: carboxypeptidase regulatory-like domain-containing protein, partial [Bryobacteraceae bacterium]